MKTSSRTVRVFLSSTFRDFSEERDLLVRKVFPELRRKCRERQVELVDVDLRWGITEKEAQQGKVLPICLAEIDRARPYFMGFIGERYGWIPASDQYDPSIIQEQPWLDEHRGGKSVTELEILHGVLNNPEMAGRAYFYFRDPKYSRTKGDSYLCEGTEERGKLSELKDRIRQSGFPVFEKYKSPESLAERVRDDLWKLIDEAFPVEEVPDALAMERRRHEAYGASRLGMYLGGRKYFNRLDLCIHKAHGFKPVLITGESGGGKSALVANWMQAHAAANPDTLLYVHYLGAGADAADPVKLVTRLLREISSVTGEELKLESEPQKIFDLLPEWLARASAHALKNQTEWLLVLDGLDKLPSLRDLRWWPGFLPQGIKLVCSCLEGEVRDAALKRMKWAELGLCPLGKTDQAIFIKDFLARYRKFLTRPQLASVQAHPLSGNPLFLKTLLEELRVFGVHEKLDSKIIHYLNSQSIDDLFEKVLERIEEDAGKKPVRSAMEAIWASRAGLAQDELLAIAKLKPAAWATIHNALDEALIDTNGQITFGHDYMRKAVRDRYVSSSEQQKNAHTRLAEWFDKQEINARVAEELPWQWQQAGKLMRLQECLLGWEVFKDWSERDPYGLLMYWLATGVDLETAYEDAWEQWNHSGEQAANAAKALSLSSFLILAGKFGVFEERLLRHCVEIQKNVLGADHHDTIKTTRSLGVLILLYKEDCVEAELLLKQALNSSEKMLGASHLDTLGCVDALGYLLHCRGDNDGAMVLYRRALESRKNLLGLRHPDTLMSADNLANILTVIGDLNEADLLYRWSLDGREQLLGGNHPITYGCVGNLAGLLSAKGEDQEAEALCRRSLEGLGESLGAAHPVTLVNADNLGHILWKMGDYKGAEVLLRRVFEGHLSSLGWEHGETLEAMNSLEGILNEKGDCEGAETIHRQWLDFLETIETTYGVEIF